MKKLKTNTLFKLVLWAVAAVTAAAMIWAGGGLLYVESDIFNDNVTYYDTRYYTGRLYRLADLVRCSVQEDALNTLDLQLEDSCISTAVYERYDEKKDTFTQVYSFTESGSHEKNGESVFAVMEDGHLYLHRGPREYLEGDRIILTTDETIAHDPDFQNSYAMFHTFYGIRKLLFAVLIGGALLEVLVLLALCACTGHTEDSDGIHLYPFPDRLPSEILITGVAAVLTVGLLILREGVSYLFEYSGLAAIACAAAAGTVCYCTILAVFLSFVRRIKAGVFWKTSITGRVCVFLYNLVREIPFVPKSAAILAILLFINIVSIFSYTEEFLWFGAIVDVIAFVCMLYQVIQCRKLADAAEAIASGDIEHRIDEKTMKWMFLDLKKHAENLNSIADGVELAVDRQMKSERLKTELITNVSHDIKTPLTSIINYADLLQKEHSDEQEQEYLEILSRNANRLKKLTEDLVEASKASTGNVSADIQTVSLRELVDQAVGEYQEKLDGADLTPVINIPEEASRVQADGRLLWRILSNLLSNCTKYAMPGTRLYIDTFREDENVHIAVKNISRDALNISADELMERFVRGDSSRTTEGSGLGLNIAKSLAEVMHGKLDLTVDGDFFKAEIILPACTCDMIQAGGQKNG